jgi:predicted ATPase
MLVLRFNFIIITKHLSHFYGIRYNVTNMTDQNTHLEHIKIKGFKSIKKIDLNMKPINILIGANGSGKSNFISLFTFLRNLSEGKLQTFVEKQGFASSFFHFSPKKTPQITIDIDVGMNGYHVQFEHGVADDKSIGKIKRHFS